nr:nucleosome assembly protein 1;3-like [Ipomoea batatas]
MMNLSLNTARRRQLTFQVYYPLYEQRFKIVIGVVEGEGNDGTQNLGVGRDEDKGIPSFWLRQVRREDPPAADLDCHLLPLAVDVVAALPGEPESLTKCH